MAPTYGLLHGFQLALKHENDSTTLTRPPLREEMHLSGLADGQKAAKHFIFHERKTPKRRNSARWTGRLDSGTKKEIQLDLSMFLIHSNGGVDITQKECLKSC